MATAATIQCKIVSGGGPITRDVFKAYYSAGTAASEDWSDGELLYLDGLYIKRIGTCGAASSDSVNTDDTGFSAAFRRFIAIGAHDASADGASKHVAVQEILPTTVLEFQLAASSSTSPTIANLQTAMATYEPVSLYKSATDIWGIDVDENEDKGVFVVEKFASTYNWMTTATTTTGVKALVQGKFLQSLFL